MKTLMAFLFVPFILTAQCPNSQCINAVPIGCSPTPFENYDCPTSINVPILQHPANSSVYCGGTTQFLPQWFTFDVTAFGWYNFYVGGLFQSTAGTGNFGALEGVMWRLAKGNCNSLEWIAASQCPTWPPTCFCPSPAWAGNCSLSPCLPKIPLIPFWFNLGEYPSGSWLPYDPTQQEWNMVFPLSPGTYYILTTAFTGMGNGESWPHSYGSGNISICNAQPLPSPPVLRVEGNLLKWDGLATVYRAENDWVDIGAAYEQMKVEGGIYCVGNEHGLSNYVHVKRLVEVEKGMIIGLDGKENARFGIKVN
jgi:hypothetical protein